MDCISVSHVKHNLCQSYIICTILSVHIACTYLYHIDCVPLVVKSRRYFSQLYALCTAPVSVISRQGLSQLYGLHLLPRSVIPKLHCWHVIRVKTTHLSVIPKLYLRESCQTYTSVTHIASIRYIVFVNFRRLGA